MLIRLVLATGALSFLIAGTAGADPVPSSSKRPIADPNQKVCETVTAVGSRLAAKKICATRAEWAEMRKQDRDVVDQAQRSANIGCNTVNTHTGAPAC
jgi:hypothetical protein